MHFPQRGGCQCGAVRYEVRADPVRTWTCHCTLCQRMTGSAFTLGIAVPSEAFEILAGELRPVAVTADSGRVWTRWVCVACGASICAGTDPKLAPSKPNRTVLAGTLDDTSWLRPTTHYWTRTKQPWVTLPAGGTVHETQDY